MNSATTSPEPTQGEPHPAVRLAELVCALIAAIAGPAWFWRFLPGGRAMWAGLHQLGQDFAALMHRLAALPPSPAPLAATSVIAPPRPRPGKPTGELRRRRATIARPRRAPRAEPPAPLPAAARPTRACAAPVARITPPARSSVDLRRRRRRSPGLSESRGRAYNISLSQYYRRPPAGAAK